MQSAVFTFRFISRSYIHSAKDFIICALHIYSMECAEVETTTSDDDDLVYDIIVPVIGCITLCLIVAAIWGTLALYGRRRQLYVQKRYHKALRNGERYPLGYDIDAIFGLNTSIILGMAMSAATLTLPYYFETHRLLLVLEAASYGPWFLIMLFLNVKNWTLYFKFKRQHYAMQSEWQSIINPDETRKRLDNNWYIRNNRTWGNLSTVYAYFGAVHLVTLCIVVTIDVARKWELMGSFAMTMCTVLEMGLVALPFVLYITIEANTPSFNDLFFIHWESRQEAKLTAMLIVILLASDLTLTLNESVSLWTVATFTSLRSLVLFGLVYVATFMVIRKNSVVHSDEQRWGTLVNPKTIDTRHPADSQSPSSRSGSRSEPSPKFKFKDLVTLNNILVNPDALNLFMLHLSKVWCIPHIEPSDGQIIGSSDDEMV